VRRRWTNTIAGARGFGPSRTVALAVIARERATQRRKPAPLIEVFRGRAQRRHANRGNFLPAFGIRSYPFRGMPSA